MNLLKIFNSHATKKPMTIEDPPVLKPAVPKPPTTAEYDIEVLIKKITTITHDYNQVRSEVQNHLLSDLTDERHAKQLATKKLTELKAKTIGSRAELAKLQNRAVPALKQQLVELTETVIALKVEINQHQATIKGYRSQLDQQSVALQSLIDKREQFSMQQQTITTILHAEQDPLKLLALAESYRQQLFTIRKNIEMTAQQHAALTTKHHDLNQKKSRVDQQLTQLNQHLSTLVTEQQTINAKLTEIELQKTPQLTQQLAKYDQAVQQTQAQLVKLTQSIAQKETKLTAWFGNTYRVTPLTIDRQHQYAISLDAFLPNQSQAMVQTVKRLFSLGTEKIGLYSALFDINLDAEIKTWAIQNGIDSERLTLINPLSQIQNQGKLVKKKVSLPQNIAEKSWDDTHQTLNLTLTDNNWQLQVSYQTDQPDCIRDISYFNAQQLTKRSFYNRQGLLAANALFDQNEVLKQEQYYRQDGLIGLVINYQAGQQTEIQLFDESGIQTNQFANTDCLTTWWIKQHFPTQCALIGHIESTSYTKLIDQTHLEAVPFVTEANLAEQLSSPAPTRFIVANHKIAQALIQSANQNLELLSLNAIYLPFQISGPLMPVN